MKAPTVAGLASLRSAGRRSTNAAFRAPWTTTARSSSSPLKPFGHIQSRNGATLVDTPTAAHDLASGEVPPESPARTAEASQIFRDAVAATAPRQNWTRREISAIYYQPLLELAHQAVSPFRPCIAPAP